MNIHEKIRDWDHVLPMDNRLLYYTQHGLWDPNLQSYCFVLINSKKEKSG